MSAGSPFMGQTGSFDALLFQKFVEISEKQASALATMAERSRQDESILRDIGETQREISRTQGQLMELAGRIATRLDHMDAEAAQRTASAVRDVKQAIVDQIGDMRLNEARSDRWIKVLCALLGAAVTLLGCYVAIIASKGG